MSLSFGLSPWLLALCVAGAAALAAWLYRSTTPEIPRWKRISLGALRFAALFLILFLLLEPILRLVDQEERRPIVAVLLDDSESLRVTSSSDTSAASVRTRIEDVLGNLPPSLRDADIRLFTFGSELTESVSSERVADSMRLEADRTNIAQALESVQERLRDENLRAAVLVSDGQYNTGRNPLYTSERFPVPIFTAVVGDTSRHRDVQIRRVTTNEIAYVDTELPVQVGVRTEELGGRPVTVSLSHEDSVVSSERITLPDGSSEITIDLAVTPQAEGLQRYSVAVTQIPGEVTHRNNAESVAVRVLESRRRVLIVAGAPGPDVSSVRQLLAADQTFEIEPYIQKDATTFYEGTFPSSLEPFDAVVLAGYPGRVANEAVLQRITEAAASGLPVLFLLTPQTDFTLLETHFRDVLPVVPERIRTALVEASFVPTLSGQRHPILNIPDAETDAWQSLPPLAYSQTRWVPSPDADVLATTAVRGVELDDPMLVVRRRTGNRTAALLGGGIWRWQNVPEDLSHLEHVWPDLFSNALQWLTAREDDRPVRVMPVRDLFGGGENVQLTGQVYDESLNPVSNASVEVQVTAPDGTVSPYVMNPIGNGRYTVDAGTLPQGSYRFEATALHDEEPLGSDQGSFAVGSLTLEYKETRANAALMRQIAHRSGGDVLDTDRPDLFADAVASSADLSSVIVEHESELDLRRHYIFLALIVILLTAEWFIRKRSGMV